MAKKPKKKRVENGSSQGGATKFKAGNPGGPGRPAGVPNAVTADVRERLLEALKEPERWNSYLAAVDRQLKKDDTSGVESMLRLVVPRADSLAIVRPPVDDQNVDLSHLSEKELRVLASIDPRAAEVIRNLPPIDDEQEPETDPPEEETN